jgi:serine protease
VLRRFALDPRTQQVVPAENDSGKEVDPNQLDPLQGAIDPFFGHGTFIAGLVRQQCPDADLLSVKLMGPDGVVDEASLIAVLDWLADRHAAAQDGGAPADVVDVVALSLGYYHEEPEDVAFDSPLRQRLDDLRALGVVVVAAAGNDSTSRPFYPAAFTPFRDGSVRSVLASGEPDAPPLISVAALNPDRSVALFSNGGDWVSCYSPGAALVSTLPVVDAGARAATVLGFPPATPDTVQPSFRGGIDPDHYTGFGTWSGTSFAAPVAAGAVAAGLVQDATLGDISVGACRARARSVLQSLDFEL